MTPDYYLILAAVLFTIGAVGVLIRRNAIVLFMCIELMLNAANLTLVTFARINGDLNGQIMADTIGPKQYSGVGGHELFVIGAHDSTGGKSIICLRSTVTVGEKRMSNIVATLPVGTPITTPRHHVQYIVTEHGVADLGLLTATERRDALIAIADPSFRDDLRASALV